MLNVKTPDDVFSAVRELIVTLDRLGHKRVSTILQHRMCVVSWTSRSELFEELREVLAEFLATDGSRIDTLLADQIRSIISVIDRQPWCGS
jgi:hypothetical protein